MAKPPSAVAEKQADQKVCFIVGPIGEEGSPIRQLADWLLKGIIKPILEDDEFNYRVKRADHDTDPGSITSNVIADLTTADLVIADLTGFNPNAFYELGIRHAIRKPAIHMIAEFVKLPFDNADQRTIFVNIADFDSVEKAKERLRKAVQAINQNGYSVTNPVVQAAAVSALKESKDPKDRVILGLEERLARLEQERQNPIAERRPVKSSAFKIGTTQTKGLFGARESNAPSTYYGDLDPILARVLKAMADDNPTKVKIALLLGVPPSEVADYPNIDWNLVRKALYEDEG